MSTEKKASYPPGWDEERVRKVLEHYERQSEEEAVAEDEEALDPLTHAVVEVPVHLLPKVRALIGKEAS